MNAVRIRVLVGHAGIRSRRIAAMWVTTGSSIRARVAGEVQRESVDGNRRRQGDEGFSPWVSRGRAGARQHGEDDRCRAPAAGYHQEARHDDADPA